MLRGFLGTLGAICLVGLYALAACTPATPSPEQLANATAIIMRAQGEQTREAISAHGTATAITNQARATETVQPAAVAGSIDRIGTETSSANTRDWVIVVLLASFVGIFFLSGLGLATLVRLRAGIVPRDASGQLPGYFDHQSGVITDPARMIGPAIALPRPPMDRLWHLRRIWHWVRYGRLDEMPEPRIQLTDKGADAGQLLTAAQAAQATTAVAALMRPGLTENARRSRLDVFERFRGEPAAGQDTSLPSTRLVLDDPNTLSTIARMIQSQQSNAPRLPAPTLFEAYELDERLPHDEVRAPDQPAAAEDE